MVRGLSLYLFNALNFGGIVLWPHMWSVLEKVPSTLEEKVHLWLSVHALLCRCVWLVYGVVHISGFLVHHLPSHSIRCPLLRLTLGHWHLQWVLWIVYFSLQSCLFHFMYFWLPVWYPGSQTGSWGEGVLWSWLFSSRERCPSVEQMWNYSPTSLWWRRSHPVNSDNWLYVN